MDHPPRQLPSAGKRYFALPVCAMRLLCDLLFPVQRAINAGGDSRFDQVKHQAGTFIAFWMAQGMFADPLPLRVSYHPCSVMGPFGWHASLSRTFGHSCVSSPK